VADLKTLSKIQTYIRPPTLPLAIKLLISKHEIPEKTKRPQKDLKRGFAIGQTVGRSGRTAWTLALGKEDVSCPLSAGPQ
jgi:uncharacterized protein (DUF169 family)